MSYVMAMPEMMAAAATDVSAVGSTLSAAHLAAAAPTVAVIPAAADEVSASIANLFSAHAQDYQARAGQAAAFHEQFVQHLNASAGSYAATEAANAASLRHLNASAGSSASAIAALPGPSAFINAVLDLWRNTLTMLTFQWDVLTSDFGLIGGLFFLLFYLPFSLLGLLFYTIELIFLTL